MLLTEVYSAGCTTFTAPGDSPGSFNYDMGTGPYSWVVSAWTKSGDGACSSSSETLTLTKSDGSSVPSWITINTSTRTIKIN